jgi:multimeric flavodoxin WrbA
VPMKSEITVLTLVCSLKGSPARSSSDKLAQEVIEAMEVHGATSSAIIRVADCNILPGVEIDMGHGDDWPSIREQLMKADVLLIATPIWMGHMSSLAQKVIERLDAELGQTDEKGRLMTYGKVGIVAVVGNEDGAHKVTADVMQSYSDLGFTIPANGSVYWVGEVMQKVDYQDLPSRPEKVEQTLQTLAANTVHVARILRQAPYPSVQ